MTTSSSKQYYGTTEKDKSYKNYHRTKWLCQYSRWFRQNNKQECNFDKGDCCGPNVVKDFCKLCQCLEKPTGTMMILKPTQAYGTIEIS